MRLSENESASIGGSIPGILPYPLVLSSPMEYSRLPIELCEAVMDELPYCYEFSPPLMLVDRQGYDETVDGQRALCACALACRAWRMRAQYLLSTFPHILDDARLAYFTMAVQESPITGLTLGMYYNDADYLDASKASEVFMRSCLRVQHFRCIEVRFDRGPPFRLLRMLPFFATITTLRLWDCSFQNVRAMMDVAWACPNLAVLDIKHAEFRAWPPSAVGCRQMSAAVENLRACQKLTTLYFNMYTPEAAWGFASAELSGVGRVFGCAVTELYVESLEPYVQEVLGILLRDSFPALRSVRVFSDSGLARIESEDEPEEPPLLHIIAIDRPIPGRLSVIVLQGTHNHENNLCCKLMVGTSEKVVGFEKRLPELLPGLAELTIRLNECRDPERCARYIWSVLPGMRNVLRFEYCTGRRHAGKPYTLPAAK